MINFNKIILFFLFSIFFVACEKEAKKEDDPIEHDEKFFALDDVNSMILYNGSIVDIDNGTITIGDYDFSIETSDAQLLKGKKYIVNDDGNEYDLFYTELPILTISTNDVAIIDDPKVKGILKIMEKGKEKYTSFIGIELRGGVSQTFPKKTYSMELWADEDGEEKVDETLLGMRLDDDWVLDGMWNEPNRIRDFTSNDIWLSMGRVQDPKQETKIGIDRKYCEVFLNDSYIGVYYLGEKIDRKQLDLEKYDDQLEGELYKGFTWADGVTFSGLDDFDNNKEEWSGYEAKYPDNIGEIDWTNLNGLVDFVVNSSKTSFDNLIFSKVDMDNLIDYYIFLNLMYATDNIGKNVYTCKFNKQSKYFFVPWDLDGSFGDDWTGNRTNITDQLLSNGLYNRLLNNTIFINAVKDRWLELRSDKLDKQRVIELFRNNYNYLLSNGIYEREALIPNLAQNYTIDEMNFIETWINERYLFLDNYYNGL